MADGIYTKFKENLLNGLFKLGAAGDTVKLALVSDSYSPDTSDQYWNSGTSPGIYEISGTGYDSGGKTLGHKLVSSSGTTAKFDNTDDTDTQWTAATFTARYGVLYVTISGTNHLIRWFDFGSNQTVTNGAFKINMNASGIITL